MRERNIAISVILCFVTCGIYAIYWMVKLNDEVNTASKQSGPNGITVVLLTLVTCGIYGWYWYYKMGEKINIIKKTESNQLLFIILAICGLAIVNDCIMQDALNKYVQETSGGYRNEQPVGRIGVIIEDAVQEAEHAVEEVGEGLFHVAEEARDSISEVISDVRESVSSNKED